MTPSPTSSPPALRVAFIGGGNMAGAIIGGLVRQGLPADRIDVVEPFDETRDRLSRQWPVQVHAAANPALARSGIVVWAVKPQVMKEAAAQTRAHVANALHLSVAAGIPTDSLAAWLGSERIVRCMPNTPALVGQGMSALFARTGVTADERAQVEQVLSPTGDLLWVQDEAQIDAVTALSGSGPAYVFYFLEAMTRAGTEMGLPADQAYRLAVGTFAGASALARASDEAPEVLRQRVTSKGGTTYAAIMSMEGDRVGPLFERALHAARQRAEELGREFGAA
ncbi:MAG: pyrroline-5-carboxylate reductase [Burkholderiales bacterium]|nr:pyrroline-5-carboxylate reductase [Burkholderiales bacterium]